MLQTISECDLFIGLDSGPIHIAAAFNKTIIGLYGPGNISVWKPFCKNAFIVDHQKSFSCAPCLQNKCIHSDFNCMDAISPDEVIEVVRKCIPSSFVLSQ